MHAFVGTECDCVDVVGLDALVGRLVSWYICSYTSNIVSQTLFFVLLH